MKKLRADVVLWVLFGLTGVVYFWLFLNPISEIEPLPAYENTQEPQSERVATNSVPGPDRISSETDSNVFDIDLYPLEFADNSLDATLSNEIYEEVKLLYNGREYSLYPINGSASVQGEGDHSIEVEAVLNFNFPERDIAYSPPLLLRNGSRLDLQALVEMDGKLRLFVSEKMIDVYREQIQLRENNIEVFDKLNIFLGRMNTIQRESFSLEQALALSYPISPSLKNQLESASREVVNEYLARQIESLVGMYRNIDLLNISQASQAPEYSAMENADEIFIAHVNQRKERNAGASSDMTVPLIYVDGAWKFYNWFHCCLINQN